MADRQPEYYAKGEEIDMVDVSKCCGAEIDSSPDGWQIFCSCCSTILDICKDTIKQEKPSITVIELPNKEKENK